MYDSFLNMMPKKLEEFKKNSYRSFHIPQKYETLFPNKHSLTKEQTEVVIDMIIWHIKMSDEDFVGKQLYGTNVYDDNWELKSCVDYAKIYKICNQNKDRACDLLKEFFWNLWY